MSTISRRDLFKFGGVAAAGAMGVSMLGGCAPQQPPPRRPQQQPGTELRHSS